MPVLENPRRRFTAVSSDVIRNNFFQVAKINYRIIARMFSINLLDVCYYLIIIIIIIIIIPGNAVLGKKNNNVY